MQPKVGVLREDMDAVAPPYRIHQSWGVAEHPISVLEQIVLFNKYDGRPEWGVQGDRGKAV